VAIFLTDCEKPCSLLWRLQHFLMSSVRWRIEEYTKLNRLKDEALKFISQE
jgi:hypothetical protein